jgi:glutathione S-transferase
LLHETGQADRVAIEQGTVSPTDTAPEFTAANPLAKIPVLILASGDALYDSRVILEFLDSTHTGRTLFPAPGPARWAALRRQALADGGMDAALLVRYELMMRPKELVWTDWTNGQMSKIRRTLDALEAEAETLSHALAQDQLTIGEIAIGCFLGYLDFRFADENWRAARPKLTAFEATLSARPSMIATKPA